MHLPAACFFRPGYSDVETGRVIFETARNPDGCIFYGYMLPLPPGEYIVTLAFDSPAGEGEQLGEWEAEGQAVTGETVDVRAGHPAAARFTQAADLPVRFNFHYTRRADITIHAVELRRIL